MDAPSREICAVKRSRTNTPLQSLALLNEVTFVEAARKTGRTVAKRSGPIAGRANQARVPPGHRAGTERARIGDPRQRYESDVKRFRDNKDAAAAFLKVGDSPANTNLDQAELAALAITANIILNMDETVTRE